MINLSVCSMAHIHRHEREPLGALIRNGLSASLAKHPFFWGLALMVATTSLWALAFVAPLAVPDVTASELALGRFFVYGLISTAFLDLSRVLRLPPSILVRAIVFAITGNIAYYVLLVLGIQYSGATMAVLIIGMLPVTVSIFGQLQSDPRGLRRLAAPLLLFGCGVVLFNAAKTSVIQEDSQLSLLGTLCILASLAMWTWYAVANSRFLGKTSLVSPAEWSSIVGLASLIVASFALPLCWSIGLASDPRTMDFDELSQIAIWSLVLGAGSTWLGTVLFNMASKLLEVSILGQLIIFEAVFGTIYVFAVAGEAPAPLELIGIAIALLAIWMSIRRIQSE